jgi:hypothetical protein
VTVNQSNHYIPPSKYMAVPYAVLNREYISIVLDVLMNRVRN